MTTRIVATAAGALVALAALVLGGWSAVVPVAVLGLVVAVVRAEVRIAPATDRWPAPAAAGCAPTGHPLTGCSNAELCLAWRVSHARLRERPGGERTEQLAALRRGDLDELERRDPVGFAAWIASGARAGGDPARHLTTAPRSP